MTAGAAEGLIMALPNGRTWAEVMPLLRRIGVEPEPAFERPVYVADYGSLLVIRNLI